MHVLNQQVTSVKRMRRRVSRISSTVLSVWVAGCCMWAFEQFSVALILSQNHRYILSRWLYDSSS
jgi:hypothetical protein